MAVRTANVWFEEFEGPFVTTERGEEIKNHFRETIVENQIVEEFFIDFTVPFSCVVLSGH